MLAANHWSNFDPWPLGIPLFPRRFLRFMAKKELFWLPLGWIVRAGVAFRSIAGSATSRRSTPPWRSAARGTRRHVPRGDTPREGGMRKRHEARWHSGAARIALAAGVPLVPAGIVGTDRLKRLGPLRVAYGAPIELGDLAGMDLAGGGDRRDRAAPRGDHGARAQVAGRRDA